MFGKVTTDDNSHIFARSDFELHPGVVGTYNEYAVTYTYYSAYILIIVVLATVTRWNHSLQHLRSDSTDIRLSARYQIYENVRTMKLLRPLTICNICGVLGSGLLITLVRKNVISVHVTFIQSNVYYYLLYNVYGTCSIITFLRESMIFRPFKRLRKAFRKWKGTSEKRVSPYSMTSPKMRKDAVGKLVPMRAVDEQKIYFDQFKQVW
uniref:G protein-coupled receptor n=1 Tax=Panagrellus redivivus TaxID=6233 RepID=A0A7E4UUY9_PANRE